MKINWPNALIATIIAALISWWLWEMGIEPLQKWLLAALGGAVIEAGLLGGMGVAYPYKRSGAQIRVLMFALAVITLGACCIFSFFRFSAQGFCVPVGVFCLIMIAVALRLYRSKM